MADLSLPPQVNTEEMGIVLNLSEFAAIYDLTQVSFLARVCDEKGGATIRYEWKSGGSVDFPNGELNYEPTSHALVLRMKSDDAVKVFNPALLAQRQRPFVYEVGFFLPGASNNLVGVGVGAFPVENGVIV